MFRTFRCLQLVADAIEHVSDAPKISESEPHVQAGACPSSSRTVTFASTASWSTCCSRGHLAEAIELERLWNAASDQHVFSLLCGYRMDSIRTAEGANLDPCGMVHALPAYQSVRSICSHHAHSHCGDAVESLDDACIVAASACQQVADLLPFALIYFQQPPAGLMEHQPGSPSGPNSRVLYRRVAIGTDISTTTASAEETKEATASWQRRLSPDELIVNLHAPISAAHAVFGQTTHSIS